jgi:cytochrome c-type biogenesis protein CcmH
VIGRALLGALLALALLLAGTPATATAAVSLPDIEDEVMCTQCGTPLNISDAPVADRQRELIQTLIDQGRSKREIKAALEAEYGPRVLAVPSQGGFDEAAWLVPLALGLLGLGGVVYAARRWRRQRSDAPAVAGPPLDAADARRLDAELAAFDR